MTASGLASLAGLISERLAQLESDLDAALSAGGVRPDEKRPAAAQPNREQRKDAEVAGSTAAMTRVRELQRQFDRVLFLQNCTALFASPLGLSDLITQLMDVLWQRSQFTFAALVLGESELGPYYYHEMRGVLDVRRYLKKQCPLPLWGELAHALVRRLNPEEPDYLLIDDIAATNRPTPDEFPWMPRSGSLIILPLRKQSVAIGALILGRIRAEHFSDLELRLELAEFATIAARVIVGAQVQEELHERAGQLAGLQLFSRSIAAPVSFFGLLANIIEGITELMDAASVLLTFNRVLIGPQLQQLLLETPGARVYQNLIGVGIVTLDEPLTLFARLYRLLTWTIDAGQPLFLDPTQPVDSPEDLYYNETGRALMTPITIGESPLGALYIEAPPNQPGYDEGDMVVLRTATNALAIAVQQIG